MYRDELCGFSRDRTKTLAIVVMRVCANCVSRDSICRANYHVSATAARRRSITRVSPLIGISQDRKSGPVQGEKRAEEALATARERAWVLARYDAIMRYGPRRKGGWARGGGAGTERREAERARKRGTERELDARTRRKETGRGDGDEGGGEGRMVLPHWPWLGPKLRWVEVLPGPLVASPSPPPALPRFPRRCPAALRAHRRAPPGLPCSSAFADSSIKDITKSTLDENTLPLYRGVPRERRAKTLRLR